METITLAVCVDCIMALANGEYPEDAARRDAIIDAETRYHDEGFAILAGGDETDTFSWSPCELCGSSLGGSRHEAAAVRRRGTVKMEWVPATPNPATGNATCSICGWEGADETYEMGGEVICRDCDEWWNCGDECTDCDEVAVDGLVCESPDCGNDGECYVGDSVVCRDCASE